MSVTGNARTVIKAGTSLGDDAKLFFGSDDDISLRYDEGQGDLRVRDEIAGSEVFSFERTGSGVEVLDGDLVLNGNAISNTPSIIPSGGIIFNDNDGAAIPSGFVLCDGNNGTPDLRDRYMKGAAGTGDEGTTGGAHTVTLTESELAGHNHTESASSNSDNVGSGSAANIQEASTNTGSTGGDSAHQNEPKHMELRAMMKT